MFKLKVLCPLLLEMTNVCVLVCFHKGLRMCGGQMFNILKTCCCILDSLLV